jgi:hypothetical protein
MSFGNGRRFTLWTLIPVLSAVFVTVLVMRAASDDDVQRRSHTDAVWYSIYAPPSVVWPRTVTCEPEGSERVLRCVLNRVDPTHELADVYVTPYLESSLTFAELGLLVCRLPSRSGVLPCLKWDGGPMQVPREVAIYRPV